MGDQAPPHGKMAAAEVKANAARRTRCSLHEEEAVLAEKAAAASSGKGKATGKNKKGKRERSRPQPREHWRARQGKTAHGTWSPSCLVNAPPL